MTRAPLAELPRIVRFDGRTDGGPDAQEHCPHCGAIGRYIWWFYCEDGTRRGAMAGCVQLFPVSKLAKEHRTLIERDQSRRARGQQLASWDRAKLDAINAVAAGTSTVDEALSVIASENARRAAWFERKGMRRYGR